jgi:hypothetical protein
MLLAGGSLSAALGASIKRYDSITDFEGEAVMLK